MKKWAQYVALVAAFIGIVVCILATKQYLKIQKEGLIEPSFCAVSETVNCDVVTASSYATLFGFPNAWWGVLFYLVAFGMILMLVLSKKERKATATFLWLMSLAAILYSLYLAHAAFIVLGVFCIMCFFLYIVNITLFVFLFIGSPIPLKGALGFIMNYIKAVFGKETELGFKPRIIPHLAVIAVVFGIGLLIMANVQAKGKGKMANLDVDQLVKYFNMQSLHDIKVDPNWSVWGNPDAKVTIVEFSDYQCPFCKIAGFGIKPYLYEFKGDIRYYFVNFPLDTSCNDKLSRQMHPAACYAARAGLCATKKGDFWSFHDDLFRNQRKLNKKFILGLAEKRGWDVEEFQACVDSPEIAAQVKKELVAGAKIQVTGTPSIFLNGKKLKYWRSPEFLRAAVEEEIEKSNKKK